MPIPETLSTSNRSSPWPKAIIATFILLAIGNIVILYLALATRVSPVDDQPYEAGMRYETTIVEREAARNAGISAKFIPTVSGIRVEASGLPADQLWRCDLELLRPNNAASDRKLSMSGNGPEFAFHGSALEPGLWLVRLRLSSGELQYYFEDRIYAERGN